MKTNLHLDRSSDSGINKTSDHTWRCGMRGVDSTSHPRIVLKHKWIARRSQGSAERTLHYGKGITKDMGINLRSTHIGMPKQGLHRASITAEAQRPRAVHQRSKQLVRLGQQRDERGCFTACQHSGDTCIALSPHRVTDIAQRPIKHLTVKKHQSVERPILRGSRYMPPNGQPGKKLANFRWPSLQSVTHPVVAREIAHPTPVGLLRPNTVVIHPDDVTKLFSQAWLGCCGIRITSILYVCPVRLVAQKEEVKRIQAARSGEKVTVCFKRKFTYLIDRPRCCYEEVTNMQS